MHDQVEVRNTVTGATGWMPASAVQNFSIWVLIDGPDPSGDGEKDDDSEQDKQEPDADKQDPSDPPEDTKQAPASGRPRSKRSSRS